MISTIVIVIICFSVIIHHLYKIEDNLKEQFKDLRLYQNHISQSIDRIEQSLYQIDDCISDIEDNMEDKSTIIERACKWLEDCAVVDIEEFRKAMEE